MHTPFVYFSQKKNPYVILRKYVAIISNFPYEHLHHYTYCSQPFELYRKTYFYDKLSNINDETNVYVHIYESQIHSNDQVSLGGFYQVLNLILMDGFHIVFMVFKPYSGVSARHGFL